MAKKVPNEITALAEQFESLVMRVDDDARTLLELIGITDFAIESHRSRLAKIEHAKNWARKLPAFETSYQLARTNLETALQAMSAISARIAEYKSQINIARSHNPPSDGDAQLIASLVPQLASDENRLIEVENEVEECKRSLSAAEVDLIASQRAMDDLARPELLPLSVQLALKQTKAVRGATDDRLQKVQQLLVLGRAALRIENRVYDYRRGDVPALGALKAFIEQGGLGGIAGGRFNVPVLFDESGTRMHGDGLMKPIANEINRMLSELRTAVAALEVEEGQLLAQANSGYAQDVETCESVYVAGLRRELAIV